MTTRAKLEKEIAAIRAELRQHAQDDAPRIVLYKRLTNDTEQIVNIRKFRHGVRGASIWLPAKEADFEESESENENE